MSSPQSDPVHSAHQDKADDLNQNGANSAPGFASLAKKIFGRTTDILAAVMILFIALGIAGHYLLAWKAAVPAMVLLGFILAPLVPAKSACGISDDRSPPTDS